jgi:uncharacterized protein (DUF1330 family)
VAKWCELFGWRKTNSLIPGLRATWFNTGTVFFKEGEEMTAYVVGEVVVKDHERYTKEYLPIIAEAHREFGGKLIARTDDPVTLHGMPPGGRMVLLEFPDTDAARRWWKGVTMKQAHNMPEVLRVNSIVALEGIAT